MACGGCGLWSGRLRTASRDLLRPGGRGWFADAHRIGTILHDHLSLRLAVLNSCEGARNSLTDPFAGLKTDKKDARWIARLLRYGLVPASFIPPETSVT